MSVSTTDAFWAYNRLVIEDNSPYEIISIGRRYVTIRQRVDVPTEQVHTVLVVACATCLFRIHND